MHAQLLKRILLAIKGVECSLDSQFDAWILLECCFPVGTTKDLPIVTYFACKSHISESSLTMYPCVTCQLKKKRIGHYSENKQNETSSSAPDHISFCADIQIFSFVLNSHTVAFNCPKVISVAWKLLENLLNLELPAQVLADMTASTIINTYVIHIISLSLNRGIRLSRIHLNFCQLLVKLIPLLSEWQATYLIGISTLFLGPFIARCWSDNSSNIGWEIFLGWIKIITTELDTRMVAVLVTVIIISGMVVSTVLLVTVQLTSF